MKNKKVTKKSTYHRCTYEDPITEKKCKHITKNKYFCIKCQGKVVDVPYY